MPTPRAKIAAARKHRAREHRIGLFVWKKIGQTWYAYEDNKEIFSIRQNGRPRGKQKLFVCKLADSNLVYESGRYLNELMEKVSTAI